MSLVEGSRIGTVLSLSLKIKKGIRARKTYFDKRVVAGRGDVVRCRVRSLLSLFFFFCFIYFTWVGVLGNGRWVGWGFGTGGVNGRWWWAAGEDGVDRR